jgi:hypothetical protein
MACFCVAHRRCLQIANFLELRKGEVRRIPIPRNTVNEGIRKGRGCLRSGPSWLEPRGLFGVEVARLTLFELYLLGRQKALVVCDVLTWSLFIELRQELVEGLALCSLVIVLQKPSVRVSLEDDQVLILRT